MAILSSGQVKMTSVLEKIVAIIAPHRCIVCSNYNNIVCKTCVPTLPLIKDSFCVLCGNASVDWRVCQACTPKTSLAGVYVRGLYDGTLKDLIHHYKFEHARDAYIPLANSITAVLPSFGDEWVVVSVPTVPSHIRARSYDHALILAKQVARLKGVRFVAALGRQKDVRQVGASRAERAAVAASITLNRVPQARKILLIDDVCTTGATLEACARILKQAGAAEVWGAVAVWQPLTKNTKKDR